MIVLRIIGWVLGAILTSIVGVVITFVVRQILRTVGIFIPPILEPFQIDIVSVYCGSLGTWICLKWTKEVDRALVQEMNG
ncbi:hypothetical protein ACFL5Z_19180 [Planctomycetota bacterium]